MTFIFNTRTSVYQSFDKETGQAEYKTVQEPFSPPGAFQAKNALTGKKDLAITPYIPSQASSANGTAGKATVGNALVNCK
ncbi:MAG: hypothetical protein HRT47_12390 [Candidatus Caenarcaniphilales bacterium]|nr:hypothetical protein [Candidatus Caenarcaniphilales bacterium]